MISGARGRSASPVASAKPVKTESVPSGIKSEDFPTAPKEDFKSVPAVGETANALRGEGEPLIAT